MFKGLFKKEPATQPAEGGAHYASPEEELLRVVVRDYCLNQHICLKDLIDSMEREIIYLVLEEARGNQRTAARMLGVRPNTLHYKIHRMGLVSIHKYMMLEELPESGQPPGSPGRTETVSHNPRAAH
jgi:transcriptional regulator with GAF, ATPase, and Fis domain